MENVISFQDFCIRNDFPLTTSYRAITKFVAEQVLAKGRPEGKRIFSLQFPEHGFIVNGYGSDKKKAFYVITNQREFRAFLAYLIGYENLVSKAQMYEIFKAATKGKAESNKIEMVERGLRRVGLIH